MKGALKKITKLVSWYQPHLSLTCSQKHKQIQSACIYVRLKGKVRITVPLHVLSSFPSSKETLSFSALLGSDGSLGTTSAHTLSIVIPHTGIDKERNRNPTGFPSSLFLPFSVSILCLCFPLHWFIFLS